MEIYGSKVSRRRQRVQSDSSYSSNLQLYLVPPSGYISLKEFDELALERLKILRTVERINLSGQIRQSEEWMNKLFDDFQKNKYFIMTADKTSLSKNEDITEARRRDHLSHFILRLAYCRSEDLRRWFVAQETDLFRARFIRAANTGMEFTSFLKENQLDFLQISEEEQKLEAKNLAAATHTVNGIDQLDNFFFKVPFVEALELVRLRKVFVKGGFAYIPNNDLVTLVSAVFRSKLSEAMTTTSRALPQIDDDERLSALLQDFDKRYTGVDYSQKKPGVGQQITPEMVNLLSATSFPLCMRHMNEQLQANHHLKHGGRMQYGLFLKAAGLKLEDALRFWRSHFMKVMDLDKFEKHYSYTIRHNYGKEGKRTDYTPYSCIKIITSSVGPGDCHGCPFRHFDANILKQKLVNYKISQEAVADIMELVNKSHFQIACQRYFEAKHNSALESGGVNHPNQYFEESIALLNGTKTPSKVLTASQVKSQHSIMSSQPQHSPSVSIQNVADISGVEAMLFDDDLDDMLFEEEAKVEADAQNLFTVST